MPNVYFLFTDLSMRVDESSRKATVKRCWDRLVKDVDAKLLADRLSDVIPDGKIHKIRSEHTTKYRAAELLLEALLLCEGTGWFDQFLQSLKECENNYNNYAELLNQTYTKIVKRKTG